MCGFEQIKELEGLGKSLMTSNRYDNQQNEIIEQIDSILLNEYNNYNNDWCSRIIYYTIFPNN